jgi:hypothetical protein
MLLAFLPSPLCILLCFLSLLFDVIRGLLHFVQPTGSLGVYGKRENYSDDRSDFHFCSFITLSVPVRFIEEDETIAIATLALHKP